MAEIDSATEENNQSEEDPESKVRIVWPQESGVPLLYSNYFAFLHTGREVVLTFGEFLPYIQKPTDEVEGDRSTKLEVKLVSRIAMSPAGFKALYEMLKGILEAGEEDESSVDN